MHDPIECDDGNECTIDSCDSEVGCKNVPDPEPEDPCVCWDFEFRDPLLTFTPPTVTIGDHGGYAALENAVDQISITVQQLAQEAQLIQQQWNNLQSEYQTEIPPSEIESLLNQAQQAQNEFESAMNAHSAVIEGLVVEVTPGQYTPLEGDFVVGLVGTPEDVAEVPLSISIEMLSWASTATFSPTEGIWSSWSPPGATVGATNVSVNFNGNYGQARIVAIWPECARTKTHSFSVTGQFEEEIANKSLIEVFNVNKAFLSRSQLKMTLANNAVTVAVGIINSIQGGFIVLGNTINTIWLGTLSGVQIQHSQMTARNCQQLHHNFSWAEQLPEMTPLGGSETEDLTFDAHKTCDPASGE